MLLAEPAGGSLERTGNRASRGMIVHDRTRLIGQLLLNTSRDRSRSPSYLISPMPTQLSVVNATYSNMIAQG